MSIDSAYHAVSGSVHPTGSGFVPARTGSGRPSRPAQLDQGIVDHMPGGVDPQVIDDISHTSAAALLDRVHHSEDPAVVRRVVTLVEHEGVEAIAELWSHADAESLPGMLWRLYLLRTWMRRNAHAMTRLWQLGEPVPTAASAIAGIGETPRSEDIAHTADAILSGAFTGDFAIALERASAFSTVIAHGLRIEAGHVARAGHSGGERRAAAPPSSARPRSGTGVTDDGTQATARHVDGHRAAIDAQTSAARLLHNAANLTATAKAFSAGARLWRQGKLE